MNRNAIVRMFAVLLVVVFAAAVVSADPMTKQERKKLIDHLKMSEKALDKATKGLTAEQWKYKASPERWSIADCVEHLALSEQFIFQRATQDMMKSPAAATKKEMALAMQQDDELIKKIYDRSQKAQAPEPLRPSNKWAGGPEALAAFKAQRKNNIEAIKKMDLDLRAHRMDFPILKDMDAYQFLLLMSAHTQRHTAQAEEVKTDAGYPKK